MKWTYYVGQKVKVAVALAIVLGLVILTNIADREYFSNLHASFATVYKDRLVVEDYILQLSDVLHARQLQLFNINSDVGQQTLYHNEIEKVLADYEKTVFTERGSVVFSEFKEELEVLNKLERTYYANQDSLLLRAITRSHDDLSKSLALLSKIQIDEGRNQIKRSEEIVASSYFLSRIELVVIIVAGLIVQMLVMSSRSVTSRFPQNSQMN